MIKIINISKSTYFFAMTILIGLFNSQLVLAETCTHEVVKTAAYQEGIFFYPCDLSEKTPATTLTAGYSNTYRNLQWMAEALAEAGYIVLAMTPTNKFGDVSHWKATHLEGQKTLKSEANNKNSPLHTLIDVDRRAISGFSMGGGGTLLAGSELKNEVKALAAFAPFLLAEDRPKVQVAAPTMILAGDRDLLVTNESIKEIYGYVDAAPVPHVLGIYKDGRHQQWYRPEIQTNRDSFKELTIAWFDKHLKGDDSKIEIFNKAAQDTGRFSRFESKESLTIAASDS